MRRTIAIATLAAGFCLATPAHAFDAGKTVDLIIGADAGGGYDLYARAVARHLPRYLPGNPAVLPRNMAGGGSSRAAAFMFSVAPKDGSAIATVFTGAIVGPLLDDRNRQLYQPTKFNYLGSADSGTRICITARDSRIKSFSDTLKQKAVLGATTAAGATRQYALLLRKATGAKFELASGYHGTAELLAALAGGQIDGICGLDWSSLKSQRPDWLAEDALNILVQINPQPEPELSARGVPHLRDFIASEEDRKAADLVVAQQLVGRAFLAPPGVPEEQVQVLRAAFGETLRDKEFLADAAKLRLAVAPRSGVEVQHIVRNLYDAPSAIVARARKLVKP